jgi:hypothetical protein
MTEKIFAMRPIIKRFFESSTGCSPFIEVKTSRDLSFLLGSHAIVSMHPMVEKMRGVEMGDGILPPQAKSIDDTNL